MGEYDKIIKENITAILLTLGKKLLGFEIKNPQDLPEKLQTTIEREPDFLKRITLEEGQDIILHLEFQLTDEPKMVYRMAEYKGIIQRKYELPVRQFVIYLGAKQPKMRTVLKPEEQITGFELRNIHTLPLQAALDSNIPEEIVLSILTDFPKADINQVIEQIVTKLRSVATDEAQLKKSLQQLITLSRIRKFEKETEKKIEAMPITYDIENDYLYTKGIKQGIKQGIEKGIERGEEKGRWNEKVRIIEKMLRKNALDLEEIASFAEVSIDEVIKIKNGL